MIMLRCKIGVRNVDNIGGFMVLLGENYGSYLWE
jgi:hypothetical protein